MDKTSPLYAQRHSAAHLLALAVKEQFDGAQLGTGPVTEHGFYYDVRTSTPITDADLKTLEKIIKKRIAQRLPFVRDEMSLEEARVLFAERNEPYKLELIDKIADRGAESVSVYRTGDSFVDLCEGPHVEHSGEINAKALKLTTLSGAYWQADEHNDQMTRIYGVLFSTPEELAEYEAMLREAARRDHRKLGKALDLFTFSDLVGPGLPLWTPRGALLRQLLDDYVWELRANHSYTRVAIPHITKKALYETSGHWQKFADELFRITSREGKDYAMKPMNCPHHTQIFARKPHSYRELPQRYAETTMVYRDEQSGELGGLTRVLSITQDDAHIFCRHNQLREEFFGVWDIIDTFYTTFGFTFKTVRLSFHDPDHPEKYLGTPDTWAKAEQTLRDIAAARGVDAEEAPGEAALYGPKVDFIATDSLGRTHQVATIQLDMNLPERFDLTCINEAGEKERIVMIHCAIMGSLERFIAVLLEHTAGKLPVRFAPVQAVVLPISDAHREYAMHVRDNLTATGARVDVRADGTTLGKRIRDAQTEQIPYMLIVGDQEVSTNTVAVRSRDDGDLGTMDYEAVRTYLES